MYDLFMIFLFLLEVTHNSKNNAFFTRVLQAGCTSLFLIQVLPLPGTRLFLSPNGGRQKTNIPLTYMETFLTLLD